MLIQLWRIWCSPLSPRVGTINGGLIKFDPGNMEQWIPGREGGGGFNEKKQKDAKQSAFRGEREFSQVSGLDGEISTLTMVHLPLCCALSLLYCL